MLHSFNVVVDGFDLDSETQNAALEHLEYTAVVGRTGGVTSVDVEIPSATSVDAVDRLRADLLRAGVVVLSASRTGWDDGDRWGGANLTVCADLSCSDSAGVSSCAATTPTAETGADSRWTRLWME